MLFAIVFIVTLTDGLKETYCDLDEALPKQIGGERGRTWMTAWDMLIQNDKPTKVVSAH